MSFVTTAEVKAHSILGGGRELLSLELEYPRFIHSQVMTHRSLAKNSASSRAIPIERMIALARESKIKPRVWGVNGAGMSPHGELSEQKSKQAEAMWEIHREESIYAAEVLHILGVHKEHTNRLLELFTPIKIIATGNREAWDHFLNLRLDPAAQGDIQDLAVAINNAIKESTPKVLGENSWHTPYYGDGFWSPTESEDTLEQALMISVSCCAQISYRRNDDSINKAKGVFSRLDIIDGKGPMHASPCEHQAKAVDDDIYELGGNLGKGVGQLRKYLENPNSAMVYLFKKELEEVSFE